MLTRERTDAAIAAMGRARPMGVALPVVAIALLVTAGRGATAGPRVVMGGHGSGARRHLRARGARYVHRFPLVGHVDADQWVRVRISLGRSAWSARRGAT